MVGSVLPSLYVYIGMDLYSRCTSLGIQIAQNLNPFSKVSFVLLGQSNGKSLANKKINKNQVVLINHIFLKWI